VKRAFVLAAALAACGPKAPTTTPGPPPVALHLAPACDLAPSAGLSWLVEAKPRTIAEMPDLIPAIAVVVPEARFARYVATHGGVDPRQVQDLCIARYRDATLTIARTPLDPARVETAFSERLTRPGGRTVEVPNPPVVRIWGEATGEAQQLVVLGREAVVLEEGRAGPARAATAFALGKLKRAVPALGGAALKQVASLVGDAPLRVFAPGPFEGEMAKGLGGLLRASTAVGASARLAGPPARIAVRLVLTGAWGQEAPAAGERLAAAVHVVSESGMGHLFGLHQPLDAPRVSTTEDALVVDATLDGAALAKGLRDAVEANVDEIFRR
jgi:hypothetical protein